VYYNNLSPLQLNPVVLKSGMLLEIKRSIWQNDS
jgi:hypothetical protein